MWFFTKSSVNTGLHKRMVFSEAYDFTRTSHYGRYGILLGESIEDINRSTKKANEYCYE